MRHPSPSRPRLLCGMCNESIQNPLAALAQPGSDKPVHFDCALREAEGKLNPQGGEKLIYIGRGRFAVVESAAYQQKRLKIIRQADWEESEERAEWRLSLRKVLH